MTATGVLIQLAVPRYRGNVQDLQEIDIDLEQNDPVLRPLRDD